MEQITNHEARELAAELLRLARYARSCTRSCSAGEVADMASEMDGLYSAVVDYAVASGPLPPWLVA